MHRMIMILWHRMAGNIWREGLSYRDYGLRGYEVTELRDFRREVKTND
jgi:hypothetical protein